MNLLHALRGEATLSDPEKFKHVAPLLIEGEEITAAFILFRDFFIFTQVRLIMVNKQGISGKKVEYHSIPYRAITQFSVETAGTFDLDCELKIWISGAAAPITKHFGRGTDVVQLQRLMAHYILR